MHPLLRDLIELDLPKGEYALFGSGPVLARGWIDEVGDLDVLARGAAWDRALTLGQAELLEPYGVEIVSIGRSITVGRRWAIGSFDTDELIDGAEWIEGIPCVLLQHVIAYKTLADRPRDRLHLSVIRSHIEGPV